MNSKSGVMVFNLVISNPPYGKSSSLSKKIVNKMLENKIAEEYVVLAPFKSFADVFSNTTQVQYLGSADKYFKEAGGTDVTLAHISSQEIGYKSYNDLQDDLQDPADKVLINALRAYNSDKTCLQFRKWIRRNPVEVELDSCAFLIQTWTGFSEENSMDQKHNLFGKTLKELNADGNVILFDSADEMHNFAKTWYSSNLFRRIVNTFYRRDFKGGRIEAYLELFPRVDWSHSWTDQEILAEIGLPEDFLEGTN